MRLSDRYIGRQVLVSTAFAIVVLSAVLLMGGLFQKLRPLLVEAGAPISIFRDLIVASLPFALIYTIPWAFLSAILLVFGRMSSDQELTGFRVAGISLARLSAPVFVIGAVLSALCLWLNLKVTPSSNKRIQFIVLEAFFTQPERMLRAAAESDGLARLEENLKDVRVYLGGSDESGSLLENLHLFSIADPKKGTPEVYIHAMRALAKVDKEKKQFSFHLLDAYLESTETPKPAEDEKEPAKGAPPGKAKPNEAVSTQDNPKPAGNEKPTEAGKDAKEGTPAGQNAKVKMLVAKEAVPVVIPFVLRPQQLKPAAMSNQEIADTMAEKATKWEKRYLIGRYWAEAQRRYASSFACLAFAFVGIPLGIKARRKDTSTGLVLSLLIGAAYFVCGMVGGSTKTAVLIGLWGPNVVCVLLGLYLLRRARFR